MTKKVTVNMTYTMEESVFNSSEFQEFLNDIKSGKLRNELMEDKKQNTDDVKFKKVTITYDVK